MNSREKLDRLVEQAKTQPPENEEQARNQQLIAMAVPMIGPMVPQDPAELDQMLLTLSNWCIETRSDEAPRFAVTPVEASS